jgi:hypothetical protein
MTSGSYFRQCPRSFMMYLQAIFDISGHHSKTKLKLNSVA